MADLFEFYAVLAQIGATFAGFGSIASVIGTRSGSDDAKVDAHRLNSMITTSLTGTLLALMPQLLASLGCGERMIFAIPSTIGLLTIGIFLPRAARRSWKIRTSEGLNMWYTVANAVLGAIALLAFLGSVLNYPGAMAERLFTLGLAILFASTCLMFARLTMSMLRPFNDG